MGPGVVGVGTASTKVAMWMEMLLCMADGPVQMKVDSRLLLKHLLLPCC